MRLEYLKRANGPLPPSQQSLRIISLYRESGPRSRTNERRLQIYLLHFPMHINDGYVRLRCLNKQAMGRKFTRTGFMNIGKQNLGNVNAHKAYSAQLILHLQTLPFHVSDATSLHSGSSTLIKKVISMINTNFTFNHRLVFYVNTSQQSQ